MSIKAIRRTVKGTMKGTKKGTQYYYFVRAVNAIGEGPSSGEATAIAR